VWNTAVDNLNLAHGPSAAGDEPGANDFTPEGNSTTSLRNDRNDKRMEGSMLATTGVTTDLNHCKQSINVKLATVVHEIVEKEHQGKDHLEMILDETKEHWKNDVECTTDFWEEVMRRVSDELNYSMEPSDDWGFLRKAGPLEENDKVQWDTIEVLHLGQPPGNDGDI
jgi:hypothetical protein